MTRYEFSKILEFNGFKNVRSGINYKNGNVAIYEDLDLNRFLYLETSINRLVVPRDEEQFFYNKVISLLKLKLLPVIETLQDYVRDNFTKTLTPNTYFHNEYFIITSDHYVQAKYVYKSSPDAAIFDTKCAPLENQIKALNALIGYDNEN